MKPRSNGRDLGRAFGDTEESDSEEPPTGEPDYGFEGYRVEFIDKVALLPIDHG